MRLHISIPESQILETNPCPCFCICTSDTSSSSSLVLVRETSLQITSKNKRFQLSCSRWEATKRPWGPSPGRRICNLSTYNVHSYLTQIPDGILHSQNALLNQNTVVLVFCNDRISSMQHISCIYTGYWGWNCTLLEAWLHLGSP